jgi:hypothetical protein
VVPVGAWLSALLSCGLLACGGAEESAEFGGGGGESGESGVGSTIVREETSSGEGGDEGVGTNGMNASGESGSSAGDETKWDMGAPDFGGAVGGCRGKIDFLFVVSSQGTMKGSQEKLLVSYPGFMHAIEKQLPGFDIHVLSANTKKSTGLDDCSVCTDGCDPMGEPPFCGGDFKGCDKKVGAGVVFPTGEYAANRRCPLDGDLRYMTAGQKGLAEAFSCMAQVGIDGAGLGGEAMAAAVQPAITDPANEDACNTGFIREDALLVVTIIQDSYDQTSTGTVDEWIAALDDAKGGDEDAYAVIVFTTDIDVGWGQLCHPDVFSATKNRLRSLTEGVKHGYIESFCIPDISTYFAEKMSDVAKLCDDFIVPG